MTTTTHKQGESVDLDKLMLNKDQRSIFEREAMNWLNGTHPIITGAGFALNDDGTYQYSATRRLFGFWNAARASQPKREMPPEMKAAIEEAHKTGATSALLPNGSAVFINYGHDLGDNDHLNCTACGGSGHIEDQQSRASQPSAASDAQPGAYERALDLYDEIECDLGYLFGRASNEGHAAGQELAKQVKAKMQRARAALATPAVQAGATVVAEPVARLHIRLTEDGLEADVQVLDGTHLQVENSPVDVYLAPSSPAIGTVSIPTWQERSGMREFIMPAKAAPHMLAEIRDLRAALARLSAAPAAQAADTDARDGARLDKFIDWYLRDGKRMEIDPFGHIRVTKRAHILHWLDGGSNDDPENDVARAAMSASASEADGSGKVGAA